MKNLIKLLGIICLAAVIGISVTACGDGADNGNQAGDPPALTGTVTIDGTAELNNTCT